MIASTIGSCSLDRPASINGYRKPWARFSDRYLEVGSTLNRGRDSLVYRRFAAVMAAVSAACRRGVGNTYPPRIARALVIAPLKTS